MKVGVGISTTVDRKDVFESCFSQWLENKAFDTIPYQVITEIDTDYNYSGVAATKNRLLDKLQDCNHIFLFDDDTYPISPDWWRPYIEHKEPHLMYQFKIPGKPSTDMRELYRDDKTVAYSHTRGAMIYVKRAVLDIVGGFDTRYYNGFEHPDYTNRIHNAGLTTHRAMDIPNSHELFYCLDQDGKVESSIKKDQEQFMKNYELYKKQRKSKEYMEFRT